MEKNKYYILRDLDDLEWFFKLNMVDFKEYSKKWINSLLLDLSETINNSVLVIYSKDGKYHGWDFYDSMIFKEYKPIDFKVYSRKRKLKILNRILNEEN